MTAMGRSSFWQKKTERRDLGLYLANNSCWVFPAAGAETEAAEIPLDGDNWQGLMAAIVSRFGPARLALVLGAGRYQLLLTDKPAVPESELADAVRWSIKDMVSEPVSSLKLDYFEPPHTHSNKVTVVTVSRSALEQLVLAADDKDCEIVGIGIEELVTARLFAAEPQARMVVSHVPGNELLLTVIKDGELWMQRRVRGFSELDEIAESDLAYGAADNLSLELQRSMDYFESQLRQPPVASIELLTQGATQALARLVGANFNQRVTALNAEPVGQTFARLACEEFLGARP
ncbi:MSHA biogenesis protein MshI [Shewanella sp. FJAT-52072]|uniref:MSHA biogenesis protein MshI n=1 Tax=Shewanella zhangzhouensis TaxID=2864213 RepID=UPI001C65FEA4|nr:MSHA biogenesis protein MshI [Shewanella zhangzhouensis]